MNRKFETIRSPTKSSLSEVANAPAFVPQAKLQAEIDELKRTINELSLRSNTH